MVVVEVVVVVVLVKVNCGVAARARRATANAAFTTAARQHRGTMLTTRFVILPFLIQGARRLF